MAMEPWAVMTYVMAVFVFPFSFFRRKFCRYSARTPGICVVAVYLKNEVNEIIINGFNFDAILGGK